MKRATREWLERWAKQESKTYLEPEWSRDVLASDARQREEIRDLRERLKAEAKERRALIQKIKLSSPFEYIGSLGLHGAPDGWRKP